MVSEKMYELGTKKSTNVPAPEFVKQAIIDILNEMDPCAVHGYTVAPGNPEVREVLAKDINRRFGTNFAGKNLFITGGAAGAITITFKALSEAGDEFITFAPYFPEYKCFVESTGASLKVVPAKIDDFQIQFDKFEEMITAKTKAIIVNSPNNPSGVVNGCPAPSPGQCRAARPDRASRAETPHPRYSEETIKKLAEVLTAKSKEYNHPIFLISDEPYREIAYGVDVPYLPKYYDNTIVCYSYSKSFSLPGERIGYIVVPDEVADFGKVYGAIAGAARVLTHVNAPSLFQLVIARCAGKESDMSTYEKNGKLLYNGLIEAGFKCVKPQGAFYLFPQSLEPDDYAFCKRAQKYDLLLVPGSDFGCPGHFRASYCIKTETIEKSLSLFKKLAEEYKK